MDSADQMLMPLRRSNDDYQLNIWDMNISTPENDGMVVGDFWYDVIKAGELALQDDDDPSVSPNARHVRNG